MKDCIGIDFDNVILKCYDKNRDKRLIKKWDETEEEWIEAIWQLLPLYNVFFYSKSNPKEVEKWYYEKIAKGDYPFKVNVISKKSNIWITPLIVGITDRKLPAVAYIGDTIKFTNWKEVLEEVDKLD